MASRNDAVNAAAQPESAAAPQARMAEIIDMTWRMRQLAAEAEWESMLTLQALRQDLLLDFFSASPANADRAWIALAVGEILEAAREMEAACRQAQASIGAQLHGIAHGNKARQAYQQPE